MHSVLVLFLEEARPRWSRRPAGSCARTIPQRPRSKIFESLLQSGKPRCGQIRDTQRDYLFGKDSIEIGSVALDAARAEGGPGHSGDRRQRLGALPPGHEHRVPVAHRRTRRVRADALTPDGRPWTPAQRAWIDRFLVHLRTSGG